LVAEHTSDAFTAHVLSEPTVTHWPGAAQLEAEHAYVHVLLTHDDGAAQLDALHV